jgi:hypothetical protein
MMKSEHMYTENHWVIIKNSLQKGKVIETTELWGTTILTVWLPATDTIVRLSPAEVEYAAVCCRRLLGA